MRFNEPKLIPIDIDSAATAALRESGKSVTTVSLEFGMKDSELRGTVLRRLYDLRRSGKQFLTASNPALDPSLTLQETLRVCEQLAQHGLVEADLHRNLSTRDGGFDSGIVKITAQGVDVVEGNPSSDIKIEFMQTNNINVTNSSGVVIGDGNSQTITTQLEVLLREIDKSDATESQKADAKTLLRKLVESPAVGAVLGAATQILLGQLGS